MWRVLLPTLFPGSTLLAGPKHSTRVPFSVGVAVALSVDVKEGPFVPNPVPGVALKYLLGPQLAGEVDTCARTHRLLLPFALQMVIPLRSPVTVQLGTKVSPGQVGGTAPAT